MLLPVTCFQSPAKNPEAPTLFRMIKIQALVTGNRQLVTVAGYEGIILFPL